MQWESQKKRDKRTEKLSEETVVLTFSNLLENINLHIQEAWQNPDKHKDIHT